MVILCMGSVLDHSIVPPVPYSHIAKPIGHITFSVHHEAWVNKKPNPESEALVTPM